MTEHETSYDAIVRAEIAIEILSQARAIVTARVYALEETDPAAAEALRQRRRDLIDVQQRLSVVDRDVVENIIAVWGPRVQDETRFWAEF
ncbi:hypothetical protein ABID16_004389 [Rhizobium aquaticum]|uniref:Uncharacterized protein n=1 Tax=Rhizobium aquaticum TaxID=1549636 RepID=A0ABV2J801_9HYPH